MWLVNDYDANLYISKIGVNALTFSLNFSLRTIFLSKN